MGAGVGSGSQYMLGCEGRLSERKGQLLLLACFLAARRLWREEAAETYSCGAVWGLGWGQYPVHCGMHMGAVGTERSLQKVGSLHPSAEALLACPWLVSSRP